MVTNTTAAGSVPAAATPAAGFAGESSGFERASAGETDFVTVAEFARQTGLSERTIRRGVQDGSLPHAQLGGRWHRILIPADALERVLVPAKPPAAPHGEGQSSRISRTGGARQTTPRWMRGTQNFSTKSCQEVHHAGKTKR
jgi:excisionase family DNA binding protein